MSISTSNFSCYYLSNVNRFFKIQLRALSEECYPWLQYQTSIACVEFISVHLRLVPASIVLEQCERLWRKLKEPFE